MITPILTCRTNFLRIFGAIIVGAIETVLVGPSHWRVRASSTVCGVMIEDERRVASDRPIHVPETVSPVIMANMIWAPSGPVAASAGQS
jgi:hypothetical protein